MRAQTTGLLAALLVAGFVPALAACGDDDQGVIKDSGTTPIDVVVPPTDAPITPPPDGGGDGGDGGAGDPLFTDFVKGLITNETKSDNRPTTVNDKKFAPDPQDPKAFPPSFF